MDSKIKVQVRSVYGRNLAYPISDNAKLICQLIGKKTLDNAAMTILGKLGFKIEFTPLTSKRIARKQRN